MQARAGVLSIHTVQAEQEPRSQTTLVPVRPMLSRNVWARVSRGSITTECSRPLMCSLTGRASGPWTLLLSLVSRASAFAVSITVVAAVTPAPFMKPRRENLIFGESAMGAFRSSSRLWTDVGRWMNAPYTLPPAGCGRQQGGAGIRGTADPPTSLRFGRDDKVGG